MSLCDLVIHQHLKLVGAEGILIASYVPKSNKATCLLKAPWVVSARSLPVVLKGPYLTKNPSSFADQSC